MLHTELLMENDIIEKLAQSDLFKGMKQSLIEDLLIDSNYLVKEYNSNDVFALAGDKVNSLMIVLDGVLIARMVSESGKFVQIDRIDAGRIIAPAIIFATENTFPVNVIPDKKTTVFFMKKDSFLKIMHKNETILANFIQIVSDINRFLSTKIHSLSLKSIRGKLAEYILSLVEIQKSEMILLDFSRQELADKFAITRQALSRSLSELEDEGVIQIKGKTIFVKDRKKLMSEE